jgi:hypothetical protein
LADGAIDLIFPKAKTVAFHHYRFEITRTL